MAATAVKQRTAPAATARSRRSAPILAVVMPPRRSDLPGSDRDLDLNTFGGRLAYARLREHTTQDDLAKAIGKVRGTVNAYEGNNIIPPLPIVEALAKALKVSPSFLAFGEHGVRAAGGANADEVTVSLDEITYGRDGKYNSGVFAMPRNLAESYTQDARHLKVYVLGHHAPAFDLRAGDRIFADTSVRELTNEYDTYLIEVHGGMEIIRVAPSFTKTATILVEGPTGDKIETKVRGLSIIGAVVSTLRSK